jgi:hypothetical protein
MGRREEDKKCKNVKREKEERKREIGSNMKVKG